MSRNSSISLAMREEIDLDPAAGRAGDHGRALLAELERLQNLETDEDLLDRIVVSETRIVSPIPSASRVPSPTAERTDPARGVPASVTPRWSG